MNQLLPATTMLADILFGNGKEPANLWDLDALSLCLNIYILCIFSKHPDHIFSRKDTCCLISKFWNHQIWTYHRIWTPWIGQQMASSSPGVQDSRQLTDYSLSKVAGFDDVPTFHRLDHVCSPTKVPMNRFDPPAAKTVQATSIATANLSNAGDWRAMTETGGFQFGGIWVVYAGTAEICTTIPDVCSRFVEQNLFVFKKCHEFGEMSDVYFCDVCFLYISNHVNLSVSLCTLVSSDVASRGGHGFMEFMEIQGEIWSPSRRS